MPRKVYLSLGSNLGDRLANVRVGVADLRPRMTVEAVSSVYETAPQGVVDQPPFLNLAVAASTPLAPDDVLAVLKSIEVAVGRRPTYRWGPRVLDIDLIMYADQVIDTPHLVVPHPRMAERAFVLVPLQEIAGTVKHPVLEATIDDLASAAPDRQTVRLFGAL